MSLSICLRIVEVSASPAATLLIIPIHHPAFSQAIQCHYHQSVVGTPELYWISIYRGVYCRALQKPVEKIHRSALYTSQVTRGMNMLPIFTAQHYDEMMRLGDLRARAEIERDRKRSRCATCVSRKWLTSRAKLFECRTEPWTRRGILSRSSC
jgi:hypothetical protein